MRWKQKSQFSGFTLVELLVVIAIIAILAAVLFPVFGMVRERARATGCLSNMRQIGLALTMYVNDKGEAFPPFVVGEYAANASGNPALLERIPGPADGVDPKVPGELFAMQSDEYSGGGPGGSRPSSDPAVHYKSWMDCIFPYAKSLRIFVCPSHPQTPTDLRKVGWFGEPELYEIDNQVYMYPSLGYNELFSNNQNAIPGYPAQKPVKMAMVRDAASKIFLVHERSKYSSENCDFWGRKSLDASTYKADSWPYMWPHNDGSAIIYADGHSKWSSRKMARKWTCDTPSARVSFSGSSVRNNCGYWNPNLPAPSN